MKYAIIATILVAVLFVAYVGSMYHTEPNPTRVHDCQSAMEFGDELDIDYYC